MVDVRHMDIDSKAELDGASLGKVHIDPWGYGVAIAYRF
jgi:outer membrane protein